MRDGTHERLLFSYWPFPPGEIEPAHGYFLRLVRAQGETSLRNFNIWNEITTEHAFPTRMLEDIEAHPMPTEWLVRLRANTPVRDGNYRYLRGHRLRFLQVRLEPRRWCRGCLHEEAYHRSWWDIESIHSCPFHGVELQSSIEGAGSVSWKWLDFQQTTYGVEFGERMDRVEGAAPYARYLMGRFGWSEPSPTPLLDGLDVSDAIEACEFVGQALEATTRRQTSPKTKQTAEIGFSALSGDRANLAETLRHKLRTYEDEAIGDTIKTYFQAPYVRLNELSREPQNLLRRAFREAYVFEKEGLQRRIVDSDFDVEFVSANEVGKRLGMGPQTARMIAEALGAFQKSRELGTIPLGAIQAISDFRDRLVSRDEVSRRLRLPKGSVNHLVRGGFLTKFARARVGRHTGGVFSPLEVADILRRLDALPVATGGSRPCKFTRYQLAYKLKPGELACSCLRGEMTLVARGKGRGFMSLILEGRPDGGPSRKPTAIPLVRDPGTVALFEAEALLNLTGAAVRNLVKSGHLTPVKRHPKITLLEAKQVFEFRALHAKASDYAACLMLNPKRLGDKLLKEGAVPVVTLGRDGKTGQAVFKRSDILRILELDNDPTLHDDPRAVVFWKAFCEAAALRCPSLILPPCLPPHDLFLRDTRRSVRVTFRRRAASAEISCVISALKAQKSWVYVNLDTEPAEISAARVVDAIAAAIAEGIIKMNATRRASYRRSETDAKA